MELTPGEKVAVVSGTSTGKSTLALVVAGLLGPTVGVVRFNDVDLRDMTMDDVNASRGLVLDSQLSLFGGTLHENISLGRKSVRYEDIRWALRLVELDEELDALLRGLDTPVLAGGKSLPRARSFACWWRARS